ncbi:MAG TPA: hypothetical protein PKK23_16675 [Nitrospirales bacterium]|nr:hypothetical protein [Nitrospiraceae bacterium]HNP30682.1 hypothetical protein [Nitrospirales bacterium]
MPVWFPEPAKNDPTWKKDGQTEFDWICTSTLPRAKAAREFLNFNLNCLPIINQLELYQKLKTQWLSTFFEIIVGRTLQVIGSTVSLEQEIPSGRKPDFHATFGNQTIIVEAVSPQFHSAEIREQTTGADRLKPFIEKHTPEGYTVFLHQLPNITGSTSLKIHKKILFNLLSGEILDEGESWKLTKETDYGSYELTLIRNQGGLPVIGGGPGATYYSQAVKYIQNALKGKKSQVKGSSHPRILAINGNFQCTPSDVDQALFGQKLEHANREIEFIANGKFGKPSDSPPSFEGVLFFEEVGFSCPREPILYNNPQSTRSLPKEFENFRQRILVNSQEIKELEPKTLKLMAALNPVTL